MRHGRLWLAFPALTLTAWAVWTAAQPPSKPAPPPPAEPAESAEESADEARERAVVKRFREVLEKNPRRGTALDRLYGHHVERGTLDRLVQEYRDRTTKDPADGTAWMVVGLLESQRGRDAAAVAAFRKAEEHLPNNPIPAYYLGQSLVLVGQPDAAAEAFERAIARKPARADLLDVFQALGRVYQRGQRADRALGVWARLEALFPDDARVQEQIATTLVEEGQYDQALPRVEMLIQKTSEDKYRQATLRMEAADLKVKLKRTPEALADLERMLGELNPDSWLYRDVRRRTEEVFLRNDDLAGLAKYYEGWLAKNPADVDAIARLAKNLAAQGRAPEAKQWLEKGVAAAPTARALRQALIDQYVFEQNWAAAAAQYEAVDKADPGNPDVLREWGKLLLKDTARPEPDRRAAAVAVWKRLVEKKPTDPVTAAQVADLMRAAGVEGEAIALYRKAIELAPGQAQYREYLGEYYHTLKRPADALATWRPIAEGANRTAKNLTRLAEVLAGFGYRKEAIAAMADAVALEKDDFNRLLAYAELLHQDGQNDAALAQMEAAGKLASNPDEAEQVLAGQIKVFQAADTLGKKIDELKAELDGGKDATAGRWLRLARYFEANRQPDQATEAVRTAVAKDPKSIPAMTAAARIYEAGGDLLAAADANRKLAALDRRFRTEYLQAVAKLEQRLGRRDQARQAGRDLLAAAPGNPEVYKFYAELSFQLGDTDEGLEALRRSVRANPSDPQGLITLADALAERARQGEAIELLWRAFEKTTDLEGKTGVIDRIARLYLEANQFDRLVERLERERREAEKARELTLCLAQAYQTAGDLGTARAQLERLLTENTRDTSLLAQLASLCESENDVASALKYQRQLTAAAPNNVDHQLKLAQLLTKSGEADEAADIWVRLVAGDTEPHRNLQSIDQLLTAGKTDAAVAILSRLLTRSPGNWELLYREGAALAAKGKADEAAARFNALLALRLSDDELGAIARYEIKQAKKKKPTPPPAGQQAVYNPFPQARFDDPTLAPLARRGQATMQIRFAVGLDQRNYYGGQQPAFYGPGDFGEARTACLGWLYQFARDKDAAEGFVKGLKDARDRAGADPRPLWDWYYFQTLRYETGKDLLPTALTLSRGADPAGLLAYITAVTNRTRSSGQFYYRRPTDPDKDTTPPLPPDQLAQLTACYRKLKQVKPEWAAGGTVTQAVMTELKRAKKADEEQAVYRDVLAAATTPAAAKAGFDLAAERNDLDAAAELFARLDRLQGPAKNTAQLAQLPTRQTEEGIEGLMGKRAAEKKFADVIRAADLFLDTARRQNLAAPRSASATRRQQTGPLSLYYRNVKGVPSSATLSFPAPNDYYDARAVSVLHCAHLLFKAADLTSDLFAHYQSRAAAAGGAEAVYFHLALGYLHWWADEKEEALARLTDAARAAPTDLTLLLDAAALREQNNEPAAALALLDSVTPLDTPMLIRREEAALRVAERLGNVDRARQAADRLFGLRLDADKQMELAGKMHRLGMHALAETVLGRAQRQAGNKTALLVRLMTQYQAQNQPELAAQVARQILRRTHVGPAAPNPYRGIDEGEQARAQAVAVLARSNQLKETIERAEAQLKASPGSVPLRQALTGYYQAAGDKAKLKDNLLETAKLKPGDGKLRYQVAAQLQQIGEKDAARDEYKAAIKLEPTLFANSYWMVQQLFAEANKTEELAKTIDEIDLKKVGSYWTVAEPISALLRSDTGRELGLKLFKKAWAAFPENRGYFLGYLYDDAVWRVPEVYGFAKEAFLPKDEGGGDNWQAMSDYLQWGQDGRIEGVVTKFLAAARRQHRLPELRAEAEAAAARRPDSVCAKLFLAILEIQAGNRDRGKALWAEAFATPGVEIPSMARFILTQELEFYAGTEDLAVKTLEAGVEDLIRDRSYFGNGPARRLTWWYEQLGRPADARRVVLKVATTEGENPGYAGGYWEYQQAYKKLSAAQELQRLGDPVEAVRLYNQLLSDPDALVAASQYGGDRLEQQAEAGLRGALKAIKPETLPTAVTALLTPRPDAGPGKPALDLVLVTESRDLGKAALTSLFASAARAADKTPDVRRDAKAALAGLAAKHPADVSVAAAAALVALAEHDAAAARAAVDRLAALVDKSPLETLPPSGRANARQRAEAAAQLPAWLVARECLARGREGYRAAGEKLAARAAEAARRQTDPLIAISVLAEWARLDRDRGDKAAAAAKLADLLALALPKPRAAKAPAAPQPAAPAPATPQPAPAPATVPAAAAPAAPQHSAPAVPVATLTQFRQAYELATLAADWGQTDLSLRAIREAVRGGPPTDDKPNRRRGFSYTLRVVNGVQYYVPADEGHRNITVDQALAALVPKWSRAGVRAGDVYEVLTSAALPDARPAEAFLYGEGQQYTDVYKSVGGMWVPTTDLVEDVGEDRGLARLLVDVAAEAGRTDDLRARAAARAGQPLGELSARALLTLIALKAGDEARARDALKALGEKIKTDATQATAERATDVLLPALADPKFAAGVVPYLEKAAENFVAANGFARAVEVRLKLAGYHLKRGDPAAARAQFAAAEAVGVKAGVGGFDPSHQIARAYLKAGWAEEALKVLGADADKASAPAADATARGRKPEPTLQDFPHLVRGLLALPADKRYAVLAPWTLPTAGRKSVRYYVGTTPRHVPPAALGPAPAVPADRVTSTLLLLAEAAKEAGKIDELLAAADKLAADKVEGGDRLRVLAYLTAGKGKQVEPAVRAYAEAARARLTAKEEDQNTRRFYYGGENLGPAPVYPSEFSFATLCLADPALAGYGEWLLGPMLGRAGMTHNTPFATRLRAARAALAAARAGDPAALATGTPRRWTPAASGAAWYAQDGYAAGLAELDAFLLPDVPLAGTFEFSVDASAGGQAGYAGVTFNPAPAGADPAGVSPVGRRETVSRPTPGYRPETFNRLTVRVSPKAVTYLLNGTVYYEDTDPPPTAPWVMLGTSPGNRPVFRNFILTGTPEVPAEVRLSAGDYLDGWVAAPYTATLPQRLTPKEPKTETTDRYGNKVLADAEEKKPVYDWEAKGGEILGRRLDRPGPRAVPSILAYFRALRPGETVRYEFFHEPGKTHVHPSLGRVAFLLEPGGVRLHWLTDAAEDDWTGLPADNAADDPAGRRAPPPLKAGDWNAVALTATPAGVRVEVNGTVVYEAGLPADVERTFGLFHYRDKTAARVRNVVLTGPWAKAVGPTADLALSPAPTTPAAATARRRQIGERYYATEAGAVVDAAKTLPPAERYARLAAWVLPTADRPGFQLAGETRPRDGAVPADGAAGRRVLLGGRLVAPCLELVVAAKEAGKLDELADRVRKAEGPAGDDLFRRSRTAFLAAVRAAQGRDADAAAALAELVPGAAKLLPFAEGAERWPDLIAVLGVLDRPTLAGPALALAGAVNDNLDRALAMFIPFDDQDWWVRAGREARARAEVAARPAGERQPYGADPGLAHWAAVTGFDGASRGHGRGVPDWAVEGGTIIHRPGHADDYLLLRVPVRGDFEVTCGLRSAKWRDAHVRYGGFQFDLDADRKKYKTRGTLADPGRQSLVSPPLPAGGDTYQFKLGVKDGVCRVWVDGREITAERVGTTGDPWLMLHCGHDSTGEVRDLKLTGKPTVPAAVDLLAGEELPLWRPYLGDAWQKRGEEVYHAGKTPEPPAEGRPVPPRVYPEAAVYYQRPLLEDGVVAYEFYYDPGKAHVHPALDRLAFLLEPDGVKLHKLTDGPSDRTGVPFDNAADEPACRRGPSRLSLRPKAWNAVRLEVKGDTVRVSVNGELVYERPIEPTNQRTFGLFHYTDRTEARIRGLTLTGDWPKEPPPADRLLEKAK